MRTKKGITQKVIADELNIDRTTYVKWETGKSNPKINKLPKLAKIFDCSIDALLYDSNSGGTA